jgi:hypothetical protein
MKVLAITIRGFANSQAALTAEDALDLRDNPLSLIQEFIPLQFLVKRDQQNDAESVGP